MEAAFFDLDKTVINKASIAAFRRPFYRGGLISRTTVLRVLVSHLLYHYMGADERRMARMRESVLRLTRGWDETEVRRIVRDALDITVEPIIYAEALDLIDRHHDEGRKVYLVSASPEEIVEPLADYLGAEGAIASRAVVDAEGRYTGEMDFYAYGPYKAQAIIEIAARDNIDLASSFAYSDSSTDIPMLETVGHPVVVNPDRALAKVAEERGWDVRQFNRPIRLRDRVPVPSFPTATAVTCATVAATGAAVIARRHWHRPVPAGH